MKSHGRAALLRSRTPSPSGRGKGEGESSGLASCLGSWRNHSNHGNDAFTLMEVMIAIGVFCIGVFAILDVVASTLHGARLLEKPMVDAGCVAGQVALTNSLLEVDDYGDLSEFLGDKYKGYPYSYSIAEVQSNHLYQAHIMVYSDAPGKPVISQMDILLYRPLSPPGTLDGGMTGR